MRGLIDQTSASRTQDIPDSGPSPRRKDDQALAALRRPRVRDAEVAARVDAARADILAVLDRVVDNEAGLPRIYERHRQNPQEDSRATGLPGLSLTARGNGPRPRSRR
jgi:hypothetical protein